MSQVRKDILNGWKEIGGYVCRDIRTVERWEKQRGLPVRRVPGAGRATVYALISELDEWLEKSKPEEVEEAGSGVEGETTAIPVSQFNAERSLPVVEEKLANAADMRPLTAETAVESRAIAGRVERGGAVAAKDGSGMRGAAHSWLTVDRRRIIAGVTIIVAMGLLCVLALPLVQSHANPTVGRSKYTPDAGERNSQVPYRSQVAGVDDLYLKGIYFYEQRDSGIAGKVAGRFFPKRLRRTGITHRLMLGWRIRIFCCGNIP